MDGSWAVSVCFGCFAFFLSNGRFPVLPIPQLPLGSVFPETSQGNTKKPQAQPPPPSRSMRAGLGGKFGARVCKCESGACARACGAGPFALTMKGTGFPPLPPPTFRRCASAWGQLPWPLRDEGGEGQGRSARVVAPRACAAGRLRRAVFSAPVAVASSL